MKFDIGSLMLAAAAVMAVEASVIHIDIDTDDLDSVSVSQPQKPFLTPITTTDDDDDTPGLACGYWKTGALVNTTFANIKTLVVPGKVCVEPEKNEKVVCDDGNAITVLNRSEEPVCVSHHDVALSAWDLVEQCMPDKDAKTVKGSIEMSSARDVWVNVYKRKDC